MGRTHIYGEDPHLWGRVTLMGQTHTYGVDPHLWGGPTFMR